MKIRHTPAVVTALAVAAAVGLAGCGSATKTTSASTAQQPTATMVGSGTPPAAGSTGTTAESKAAAPMATGKHDHAGQFCSGRYQAKYAGEGLICVTGRLKPTK